MNLYLQIITAPLHVLICYVILLFAYTLLRSGLLYICVQRLSFSPAILKQRGVSQVSSLLYKLIWNDYISIFPIQYYMAHRLFTLFENRPPSNSHTFTWNLLNYLVPYRQHLPIDNCLVKQTPCELVWNSLPTTDCTMWSINQKHAWDTQIPEISFRYRSKLCSHWTAQYI